MKPTDPKDIIIRPIRHASGAVSSNAPDEAIARGDALACYPDGSWRPVRCAEAERLIADGATDER